MDLLNNLLSHETIQNITMIYIPQHDKEDEYIYLPNENGHHMVKSFYLIDQDHRFSKGLEPF